MRILSPLPAAILLRLKYLNGENTFKNLRFFEMSATLEKKYAIIKIPAASEPEDFGPSCRLQAVLRVTER